MFKLVLIILYQMVLIWFLSQKATNGQINSDKTSPIKKTSAAKAETSKKTNSKEDDVDGKLKENKQDDNKVVTKKEKEQAKAGKENKMEQVKNKKNLKNLYQEKPVDFDDGLLIYVKR